MPSLKQIWNEILIRMIPLDISIRRKALFDKYIQPVRFKGKNIHLTGNIQIIDRKKLVLGSNITINGGAKISATSGIMIGNDSILEKNAVLTTRSNGKYSPIIIGAGNTISKEVSPGTILQNKKEVFGMSKHTGQIVFIVSTGRSGSKAIAKMLNNHSDAECFHDSFPHLNPWSCDYLYGLDNEDSILKKLEALYNSTDVKDVNVHGQSDQKLSAMIPILAKLFPKCKFIWLIREADSFVNSSYARGWFDNSEFGYEPNKNEFFDKKVTPSVFDAAHRLNGYKCGEFSEEEWKSMTAFERNCWYWGYWNSMIEENLEKIDGNRSIRVRLSSLGEESNKIQEFLGIDIQRLNSQRVNKANYQKSTTDNWSDEMKAIYNKHCRNGMDKWFAS